MSRVAFLDDVDLEETTGNATLTEDTATNNVLQSQNSALSLFSEASSANLYAGTGYALSTRAYQDPSGMARPYYFTTKLGAPFPSYHSNPDPFFPPRWTSVKGAKLPLENITAPRIRLAPKELEQRHLLYRTMASEAAAQTQKPKPKVLNLAHQLLGDPYQRSGLKLMLNLNDSVEVLNLNDNELDDISDLPLSNVRKLYLDNNSIVSFAQIPPLVNCRELIVTNNFITSFNGLEALRFPKLVKLCVHGNPICTKHRHRAIIISLLPSVKMVDLFTRSRIEQMKQASVSDIRRGEDDDECC